MYCAPSEIAKLYLNTIRIKLAMCSAQRIASRTMSRFLMLWPDISRMGRVTSDVRYWYERIAVHLVWAHS